MRARNDTLPGLTSQFYAINRAAAQGDFYSKLPRCKVFHVTKPLGKSLQRGSPRRCARLARKFLARIEVRAARAHTHARARLLALRKPRIEVEGNDHAHRLLLDVLFELSDLNVAAAAEEAAEVARRRS